MPDYDIEEFKTAKAAYLKLILRIKKSRKYSIGRSGLTYLSKDEETEQTLRKYIGEMQHDEIALKFSQADITSLTESGVDCSEELLAKGYAETMKNGAEYFVLVCNNREVLDQYIRKLYIPGSLGFRIENNGRNGIRMLADGKTKSCSFTTDEACLLVFLFENANEPQRTEIIMQECNLTREQISSACHEIRSKMNRHLDYTPAQCKRILPLYVHGSYVLNILE